MKKRIISVLILSLIAAGMIGCGDESSSSSSTSVASSSSSSSSTEKEDNKSETGDITEEMVNNHEVTDASKFKWMENVSYPEYGGIYISAYIGEDDDIVVIPEEIEGKKVVGIEAYTFSNHKEIEAIKFPDTFKYIGKYSCGALDNTKIIMLGSKVEIIEEGAFVSDKSLISINLPEGLKKIGEGAFGGCESLKELKFPESVGVPDNYCFASMNKEFTLVGKPGIGLEKFAKDANVKFSAAE